jgi:hypothetical protein
MLPQKRLLQLCLIEAATTLVRSDKTIVIEGADPIIK